MLSMPTRLDLTGSGADLLNLFLHHTDSMVGLKDLSGTYLFASRAFERLCGSPAGGIIGKTDFDVLPEARARLIRERDQRVIDSGEAEHREELIEIGGQAQQFLSHRFPVRDAQGRLFAIGVVAVNISEQSRNLALLESALNQAERSNAELQQAVRELEQLARTDRLTGAWNRLRFEEAARDEMNRSQRYGVAVSLAVLDMDHFKRINDRFGHPVGDRVLRQLVALCRQHMRITDSITRWGGEEFILLAPHTSLNQLQVLMERLRQHLADSPMPDVGQVSASIGVAEYREEESLEAWIERADRALYLAKHQGRNRVAVDPHTRFQPQARRSGKSLLQLRWEPSYACGHGLIDAQHQALFALVNQLLERLLAKAPETELVQLMEQLLTDLRQHFRDEEQILARHQFTGLKAHRQEHGRLLEQAATWVDAARQGRLELGTLFNFLAYEVVVNHMLDADREYFEQLLPPVGD